VVINTKAASTLIPPWGMGRLIGGLVIFVLAGVWEALNDWHLIDFLITKLRSEGSAGMFLANVITSPVLRLVLILVGMVIAVKGLIEQRAAGRLPPLVPGPPSAPISSPSEKRASSPEKEQVVDIEPQYLTGLFEKHTSLQAQELVQPFIGKWMNVSGPLGNAIPIHPTLVQVSFENPNAIVGPHYPRTVVLMYCHGEERVDYVRLLKRGDMMKILGQIKEVGIHQVILDNCIFLDWLGQKMK
jgi:hypothetical protein